MLRGCGAAAHWCTPCVCKRPNRVDNRDSRGDTQHEIGHICKRSHLQEVNCANIMANIDSACQPDSGAGFWVPRTAPTPRPLKHSHLKKHTAVARATAGKVLASRAAGAPARDRAPAAGYPRRP